MYRLGTAALRRLHHRHGHHAAQAGGSSSTRRSWPASRTPGATRRTRNRTKDDFLATLSHELRTPIAAILGWAQVLTTVQRDEATLHRALESIERNARQQVQLIDDLLDLSRIIAGKLGSTCAWSSTWAPC